MKRLTAVIVMVSALLCIGLLAITFTTPSSQLRQQVKTNNTRDSFSDHQRVTITVGDSQPLVVEVVNTPASITQGLSDREEIGTDGMLFFLEKRQIPRFWMKQMKFDLDMIWIDENKVVEITEHVPAPSKETPLSDLPTYSPAKPASMVLEIPAGSVATWGIAIDDELRFSD